MAEKVIATLGTVRKAAKKYWAAYFALNYLMAFIMCYAFAKAVVSATGYSTRQRGRWLDGN